MNWKTSNIVSVRLILLASFLAWPVCQHASDFGQSSPPEPISIVGDLGKSLSHIVIPIIKFNEVQALTAFRVMIDAINYHSTTGRSYKLIFSPEVALRPGFFERKISLQLQNIAADEALRYLAILSYCHSKVEDDSIVIIPSNYPD